MDARISCLARGEWGGVGHRGEWAILSYTKYSEVIPYSSMSPDL